MSRLLIDQSEVSDKCAEAPPLPHLTGEKDSAIPQPRINLLLPLMVMVVGLVLCFLAYQHQLQIGQFQPLPWLNIPGIFGVLLLFLSVKGIRQWITQRKENAEL